MTQAQSLQRYIGSISGTSLDGVDVGLIEYHHGQLRLDSGQTYPYPPPLRDRLMALCQPGTNEIAAMLAADVELGRFIAQSILGFLKDRGLKAGEVRAIGSHGQTIRHLPDGPNPNTLQIGDPNTLAEVTGITTVADFRRRDMAAGGQGAPLVPAFHKAVFAKPGETRVVVNIGGIANITILPSAPDAPVIGFDTGPGNVLMDGWYRRHLSGDCDRGGQWASSGTQDEDLLRAMGKEAYLHKPAPKSTGRELFNEAWLDTMLGGRTLRPEDVQASLCQFTARTIVQAIRDSAGTVDRILVCGGGVHNGELMRRLQAEAGDSVPVGSTAELGIDPDFVEAACFAWMAAQTLDGSTANLPSVTGARRAVILGGIYPAP